MNMNWGKLRMNRVNQFAKCGNKGDNSLNCGGYGCAED